MDVPIRVFVFVCMCNGKSRLLSGNSLYNAQICLTAQGRVVEIKMVQLVGREKIYLYLSMAAGVCCEPQ